MIQKYPLHSRLIIMDKSSNYFKVQSAVDGATNFGFNSPTSDVKSDVFPYEYLEKESKIDMFHLPTNSDENQLEVDGLFRNLRGFLIFGKVIGVIPFSGVFEKTSKNLSYRPKSLTAIVTYIIIVVLIFNASLGLVESFRAPKRNALEIANSIRATLYFLWGCYIYIVFLYRSNDFLKIFKAWESLRIVYTKKDLTLRRDVTILAVTILLSAGLENAVLHLEYIKQFDSISGEKYGNSTANMSTLETFHSRAHYHWAKMVGYNWFFALIAFIQHKWILYSWNYIDILISVMARALYFRFKALYDVAEIILLGVKDRYMYADTDIKEAKLFRDPAAWLQIVHDHTNLCRILEVLEGFFSPLIFASYCVNMFYICLQLLDGLTSDITTKSIVHSIYAPWSFLHLILRIFTVSICCARINTYAHKVRDLFQECPPECYTKTVSRLDKRITSGPPIGLTGLQCYTVTKPFILSVLGVVFTFEIVLLQCVPSDSSSQPINCPK